MAIDDPSSKYAGMTLNERLFNAGLLGQFDEAVRSRDSTQLKSILIRVDFSEGEAVKWLSGGLDQTYWLQMLPVKLREFNLKADFESAIRSGNRGAVTLMLQRMGASPERANDLMPTLMHNYFSNLRNAESNG